MRADSSEIAAYPHEIAHDVCIILADRVHVFIRKQVYCVCMCHSYLHAVEWVVDKCKDYVWYVISDNCMAGYKIMLRIQAIDDNEWNKK